MMKRVIGWIVLLPLCALLILFALANRHVVGVGFDPISPERPLVAGLQVPMFLVIYAFLILGILLGGLATWLSQHHYRQERRHYRRETERLASEVERVRQMPAQRTDMDLLDADGTY